LKKWNTQRSNGMSSIIKNGKRNIGYSLHLVALRLLVSTLLNLVQVLAEVARRLADGLPPTVQHDDLHDGNVFTRDGRTMLIDWGDAVFAHPFGTLLVTRGVLAAQLEVTADDAQLRRVTDAYLEAWRTGGKESVGYKPVPVADVEAGKMDPYAALYGLND